MIEHLQVIKDFCMKRYSNNGSCNCPLADEFDCLLGSYPINWNLWNVRSRLTPKAEICSKCHGDGGGEVDGGCPYCNGTGMVS